MGKVSNMALFLVSDPEKMSSACELLKYWVPAPCTALLTVVFNQGGLEIMSSGDESRYKTAVPERRASLQVRWQEQRTLKGSN